jgi:type I restriction enzyme S subunit
MVKTMFDLQSDNKKEIEELAKQRDELMPLLMNGQVTLK